MIKILHVISGLNIGGAETALNRLVTNMDRAQFENYVVSMTNIGAIGKQIESAGIRVFALGNQPRPLPEPQSLQRYRALVRELQPHLIQAWMYHANILTATLHIFHRQLPLIWNIRNSYPKEKNFSTALLVKFGALLSGLPKRIIYNSTAGLRSHIATGYKAQHAQIIPNGFDTTHFAPNPTARAAFRAELGVGEDTILIGLLARWHPDKDLPNFLHAAAQLTDPRVKFVMAGHELTTQNKALQKMLQDLNLSSRLLLLGERLDAPQLLAGLDILTSSSLIESFSNVIGEAMACGVPCVVTDVGDSAYLVGDTGTVVPPRQAAALAQGWQTLLDLSRAERAHLGASARARICQNFSLAKCTQTYQNLYEGLRAHA